MHERTLTVDRICHRPRCRRGTSFGTPGGHFRWKLGAPVSSVRQGQLVVLEIRQSVKQKQDAWLRLYSKRGVACRGMMDACESTFVRDWANAFAAPGAAGL